MFVTETGKCVFVLDETLSTGLAANAAAVLATALTNTLRGVTGWDVSDADGEVHVAITQVAFPMLKASTEEVVRLHALAQRQEGVFVADFSHTAQHSRRYEEYAARMAQLPADALRYLGIVLYGERGVVTRLTGHLPLL